MTLATLGGEHYHFPIVQLRKTGAQSHQGELGFKAEPVLTDRLWVLRQFEHISSPVKQDGNNNTLMGGWSD